MSLLSERMTYTNNLLDKHSDKKEEIIDLFRMMEDEIADGESPDEEFEKFKTDVEELIHGNN